MAHPSTDTLGDSPTAVRHIYTIPQNNPLGFAVSYCDPLLENSNFQALAALVPAPHPTMDEALEDVCARFLAALPEDEARDAARLGFHLEQAHWYYVDFLRDEDPDARPSLGLRAFATVLAGFLRRQAGPVVAPAVRDMLCASKTAPAELVDAFAAYKALVPTCGAIILDRDMDAALVVRGHGPPGAARSWTFPKGKIAKDEAPADCARREVLEETGFDVGAFIRPHDFIQVEARAADGAKPVRMYIVHTDLDPSDSSSVFAPLARNEIGDIQWHPLRDMRHPGAAAGKNKYYNVLPFMQRLSAWVAERRASRPSRRKARRAAQRADDSGLVPFFASDDVSGAPLPATAPAVPAEKPLAVKTKAADRPPAIKTNAVAIPVIIKADRMPKMTTASTSVPGGVTSDSAFQRFRERVEGAVAFHMGALRSASVDGQRMYAAYLRASGVAAD